MFTKHCSTLQQQISEALQGLHAFQLQTVLQFVQFLQHQQFQNQTQRGSLMAEFIDQLNGKYRHCLSSSHEFARLKPDEIALEEAKWQRR
jgi:ABC-type thiamine transport system substrate-binding protein